MSFEEIMNRLHDIKTPLPDDFIEELIAMCNGFADKASTQNEDVIIYMDFHGAIQSTHTSEDPLIQILHEINQKYITNASKKDDFPDQIMAFLFVKNVEYYLAIQCYADCMRYAGKILSIPGLNEMLYISAITAMAEALSDDSLLAKSKPYVEQFISYLELDSLPDSTRISMYITLIETGVKFGLGDSYLNYKEALLKLRKTCELEAIVNYIDAAILLGDLYLTNSKLGKTEIAIYKSICKNYKNDAGMFVSMAPTLLKLTDKMLDYIDRKELIDLLIGYAGSTTSTTDKLAIYEYLLEKLNVSLESHPEIAKVHFNMLRSFYRNVAAFNRQEFQNELTFLRESEEKERIAKFEGMSALSGIYVSMHLINLEDYTFTTLKTNEFIEKYRGRTDGMFSQTQLLNVMNNLALPSYTAAVKDFCDLETLKDRLKGKKVVSLEFKGQVHGWCRARFIPVTVDSNGYPLTVIYAVEPINEQKEREETLRRLSETDLLTTLRNRGSGEELAKELIEKKVYGMLAVMDIDNFKSINDNFGHDVGDSVIREMASCLKKTFRENDVVFRLGGDEFAVYAPDVCTEDKARAILKRLLSFVNDLNIPDLYNRKATLSIGVALYKEGHEETFDSLYKRADQGVYKSKRLPGNASSFM